MLLSIYTYIDCYNSKRIANPNLSIEECLRDILAPENDYSTQCQNFYNMYTNMRNWLERARNEHFI